MKKVFYLNGKYLSQDKLKVSPFDAGFLYGDGIFETIRIYNGAPIFLEHHIRRLRKGLKKTKIKMPEIDFSEIIRNLIRENRFYDGILRITITRGECVVPPWTEEPQKPTIFVYLRDLNISEYAYKKGIKIIFVFEDEFGVSSTMPGVKSLSYQSSVVARILAKNKGAGEAIFVDPRGFVTEGAGSNIFFVNRNKIKTPGIRFGVLSGVTRGVVLQLARSLGFDVEECNCPLTMYKRSEGVFLTNSAFGVLGVRGKITDAVRKIQEEYLNLIRKESEENFQ